MGDIKERISNEALKHHIKMQENRGAPDHIALDLRDSRAYIKQLLGVIDRGARAWLSLEPGIGWEGDLGDAMIAAVREIEKLRAGWETDEHG